MDTAAERAFREALMRSLVESAEAGDGTLARADLTHFRFADRDWRLVDESRGIRNPSELETTLAIIHNPRGPYADREISPGVWEYAYEKGSPEGTNTKLRRAGELGLPVIFFLKLDTAVFVPVSLAFVIDDDRDRRVFTVALEEVGLLADPLHPTELQRRYAERIVRQRMHQPAFRGLVLRAYALRCTPCSTPRTSSPTANPSVPRRRRTASPCARSTTPPTTRTCSASAPTTGCRSTAKCSTRSTGPCCGTGCRRCTAGRSRCPRGAPTGPIGTCSPGGGSGSLSTTPVRQCPAALRVSQDPGLKTQTSARAQPLRASLARRTCRCVYCTYFDCCDWSLSCLPRRPEAPLYPTRRKRPLRTRLCSG